jgi:hypothetical protein
MALSLIISAHDGKIFGSLEDPRRRLALCGIWSIAPSQSTNGALRLASTSPSFAFVVTPKLKKLFFTG